MASFSEADRWNVHKSHELLSYEDTKSGIYLMKHTRVGALESEVFCLLGDDRRMPLPFSVGSRMWNEACRKEPENNRTLKDSQWFLERFKIEN